MSSSNEDLTVIAGIREWYKKKSTYTWLYITCTRAIETLSINPLKHAEFQRIFFSSNINKWREIKETPPPHKIIVPHKHKNNKYWRFCVAIWIPTYCNDIYNNDHNDILYAQICANTSTTMMVSNFTVRRLERSNKVLLNPCPWPDLKLMYTDGIIRSTVESEYIQINPGDLTPIQKPIEFYNTHTHTHTHTRTTP
eukprot:GHVR01034020.1.p1 GENE.GHVR01034020.1~~GHVR01034020.1.p1  ORF type:complete len:196 (-),score=44.82 GHVR01034020.1:646-1233(-)